MRRQASELIFISRIKRDGSGVVPITEERQNELDSLGGYYELTRLSVSEDTYIAHGFNSYVVKLKNK